MSNSFPESLHPIRHQSALKRDESEEGCNRQSCRATGCRERGRWKRKEIHLLNSVQGFSHAIVKTIHGFRGECPSPLNSWEDPSPPLKSNPCMFITTIYKLRRRLEMWAHLLPQDTGSQEKQLYDVWLWFKSGLPDQQLKILRTLPFTIPTGKYPRNMQTDVLKLN